MTRRLVTSLTLCAALCAGGSSTASAYPPNDMWHNAFQLNTLGDDLVPVQRSGDTTEEASWSDVYWHDGTQQPEFEVTCPTPVGDVAPGPNVWYAFYTSAPGRVRLVTTTSAFDPMYFLFGFDPSNGRAFDGSPAPGNQQLACTLDDDASFYVTPGSYKFSVSAPLNPSVSTPRGPFDLELRSFQRDGDGDTVVDDEDQCPAVAGSASHGGCLPPEEPDPPAPPPGDPPPPPVDLGPNTCPAGITPPSGEFPSVSVNGGAVATRDPQVTVGLSWPSGTTEVLLSNDNGGPYQSFPPSRCIGWRLEAAGIGREARVVYARFRSSTGAIAASESDNIILDQARPKVIGAGGPTRNGRYQVAIRASDAESGVAQLEVLDRRRRALETVRVCARDDARCSRALSRSVTVEAERRPALVRAIDAAGNQRVRVLQWQRCRGGRWKIVGGRPVCVKRRRR